MASHHHLLPLLGLTDIAVKIQRLLGAMTYSGFVKKVFASPVQPCFMVYYDSEVGACPGKVAEVNWKCVVDCLHN